MRTSLLARSAFDAFVRAPAVCGVFAVEVARAPVVELNAVIHTGEESGDRDILRATLGAIFAIGARDKRLCADDLDYLVDCGELFLIKWLEVCHIGEVVVHHVHISHARQHHFDALEACRISYRVACV